MQEFLYSCICKIVCLTSDIRIYELDGIDNMPSNS